MNIDLNRIVKETQGKLESVDERDISLIAGSCDVGAVQSLMKVLRVAQKNIQRQIRDKAKISDVFAEDVRFLVGMDKMADEVLGLSDAAQELLKRSASK
jgi:hypothetical protein